MGTPLAPATRLYIHTLGCPKNEADSRTLMRSLVSAGVTVVDDPEQATHIVVNTCGFIQEAKEESIGAILEACGSYPGKTVLAMGCLVERYRAELREGISEVAGWFGLAGGPDEEGLIRLLSGGTPAGERRSPADAGAAEPLPSPVVGAPSSWAYIKISDGCDEPCTFCAIPAIKGPYQSLSTEEILRESRACLSEGARELVLVGQDTTRWADGELDLAGLVDLLAADERVARLRVMYLQPERVTDSLLRRMAAQPKLCRYLDIPFQHSHPDVLRRMARWGDGQAYVDLLERARRMMPDVALRSSLIVGFPGETEDQFEHLLDFVRQAEFDYAGGLVYSPEEGTGAEKLRPRVQRSVAVDRLNRLNELLMSLAEQKHQRMVGTFVEVMVDSLDPEETGDGVAAVGRVSGQAPQVDGVTYIEGEMPRGTAVGDIVEVTVTAAVGYDLVGVCDAS
ncbi:MAG: 30S ribosomal protein S12 methylthiotransferase RimO [Thermoleophilia bacterium]|nr:30S ribosomal protein S12 methylthiotransferase RimO [Thermoleophilia bacterium]